MRWLLPLLAAAGLLAACDDSENSSVDDVSPGTAVDCPSGVARPSGVQDQPCATEGDSCGFCRAPSGPLYTCKDGVWTSTGRLGFCDDSMPVAGAGGQGGAGAAGQSGGGQSGAGQAGQGGAGQAGNGPCGEGKSYCAQDLTYTCCDAEAEYCDYGGDALCGFIGHCQPRPTGDCPAGGSPVCGCDGQTHDSACQAHQAGTTVARLGPCGQTPDPPLCGDVVAGKPYKNQDGECEPGPADPSCVGTSYPSGTTCQQGHSCQQVADCPPIAGGCEGPGALQESVSTTSVLPTACEAGLCLYTVLSFSCASLSGSDCFQPCGGSGVPGQPATEGALCARECKERYAPTVDQLSCACVIDCAAECAGDPLCDGSGAATEACATCLRQATTLPQGGGTSGTCRGSEAFAEQCLGEPSCVWFVSCLAGCEDAGAAGQGGAGGSSPGQAGGGA